MRETTVSESLLNDADEQLETAPTLVTLVHTLDLTRILQNKDYEYFEGREYDPEPIACALLCRELGGLSWKGLYEHLSTETRASRLGFDATKFGKYNTAPTRQTLTAAWDEHLSNATKRRILSVSERLVEAASENDDALDLRQPRYVEDSDTDLRERHVGEFSNDQIRKQVRLARNTVFGSFNSRRAGNVKYPDSRFNEL